MMRWPLRIARCYPLQLDYSLSSPSAGISHLLAQMFILTPYFPGVLMKSLLIFALLALASLSACGQKGDLILPDDSLTHDKSELG